MSFLSNKTHKKKKDYKVQDFNMIITDLDDFFKNIYDYYHHKGFSNILTQTILDNISIIFSIHFIFFNIVYIDWFDIIKTCKTNSNKCDLELFVDFQPKYFNHSIIFVYLLFMLYYFKFLYKSLLNIYRMRAIQKVYENKLRIKGKEMENIEFIEIADRLIELQRTENYCRVKENLTYFDIIGRILRKTNYIVAIISNNVIDLNINLPLIKTIDLTTQYNVHNIKECILNYAFLNNEAQINKKFLNLRLFQLHIFWFYLTEIIFIVPFVVLKIIFWFFRNADLLKSDRGGFSQKLWSTHSQYYFRNYNELQHEFEFRMNQSLESAEDFFEFFKERMFNIIGNFFIIVCGSFFFLIVILSIIDEKLLTDIRFSGKNLLWYMFILGIIMGFSRSLKKAKPTNSYKATSINQQKQLQYITLVNQLINIPDNWRYKQNLSSKFTQIYKNYQSSLFSLWKEIVSILLFPVVWIKFFINAQKIIRFMKNYSKEVEGVGDVCVFSIPNIANHRIMKEKAMTLTNFNERKFLNSLILYKRIYRDDNEIQNKEIHLLIQNLFETIKYKENSKDINYPLSFSQFESDIYYYTSEMELSKVINKNLNDYTNSENSFMNI